jgi:hypothetical protein
VHKEKGHWRNQTRTSREFQMALGSIERFAFSLSVRLERCVLAAGCAAAFKRDIARGGNRNLHGKRKKPYEILSKGRDRRPGV